MFIYILWYYGCGWLLAVEQRGIYGQNVVNMILSVEPGLAASELITMLIFACLNSTIKFPRITLQQQLIFLRTHKFIPATQKYLIHSPKTKNLPPVASSVYVHVVLYWANLMPRNPHIVVASGLTGVRIYIATTCTVTLHLQESIWREDSA